MSDNKKPPSATTMNTNDQDTWIVLIQFFPAFHVFDAYMKPLADLYSHPLTTMDIEGCEYKSKSEAKKAAIMTRESSPWFEDWDEVYGSEEDDEDIWSSVELHCENYDEEQYQCISVTTLSDYHSELKKRDEILQDAHKKYAAKKQQKKNEKRKKILKQKRVYYSFPPTFDIPAEAEVMFDKDKIYAVPRANQHKGPGEHPQVIHASSLSSCCSIQMRSVDGLDKDSFVQQTELIFKECTNLKELYWHNAKYVKEVFNAPHAQERLPKLTVLSIPYSFNFTPLDLGQVQHCEALQRLDLRSSFDIQESVMSHAHANMFRSTSEQDDTPSTPYLGMLLGILECCENLEFVDLEGISKTIPYVGRTVVEHTIGLYGIFACLEAGVKVKVDEDDNEYTSSDEDDEKESSSSVEEEE